MGRAERLWLISVFLFVLFLAAVVGAWLDGFAGSLCEGQRPGVCEAYEADRKFWQGAAVLLLVGFVAVVWRAIHASREERDTSARADDAA